MNVADELLKKIDVARGSSINRAIQRTRDYLDSQDNPLKTANHITTKFNIPPTDNVKKAYVFVMTAVEQSLETDTPSIQAIMDKANARIKRITDIIGPKQKELKDPYREKKKLFKRKPLEDEIEE